MTNEGNIGVQIGRMFIKALLWIIKTLFKIIWGLVKWIFRLIFGIEKEEQVAEDGGITKRERQKFIREIHGDIESAVSKFSDPEKLDQKYYELFLSSCFNAYMTLEQKCQALELLNKKVMELYPVESQEYLIHNLNNLEIALAFSAEIFKEHPMLGETTRSSVECLDNDIKNGSLGPYTSYLGNVLMYAGINFSPTNSYKMDYKILDKFQLASL